MEESRNSEVPQNYSEYTEVCDEACQVLAIHPEMVVAAKTRLADKALRVQETAEFFKVFGDPTRLRILQALSVGELCVCDLCAVLDMGQSAISHQLRILKQARLVHNRKEGKVVHYSLDDEHVMAILETGMEHVGERSGEGERRSSAREEIWL